MRCGVLPWVLLATVAAGCAQPVASDRQSVTPGINERWMGPDVVPLVATLESERREIWINRERLAAVTDPAPGSVVADIGAGSGFMVELFSALVGPQGKVYAVDVNPVMMQRVADRAREAGLTNLETVVCTQRSVNLLAASVDLMFICDTYHHFEYPQATMRSIHEALRPGGQILLVDFERIPGVSRPFILEHCRAGREVFTREIIEHGFELIEVHEVPALKENYVLRFRKTD